MDELLGFLAVLAVVVAVACLVAYSRLPSIIKLLVYAALVMRVVGSWLRHTVLFEFYQGSGDARRYSARGMEYAEQFLQLDFSPFFDPTGWVKGQWYGTQFVSFPAGIIHTLIGPSLLGGFLAFSLLAFIGVVGFAVAFRRSYPHLFPGWYFAWIFLFPSLWYWPSSIGKEAIVIMGLGLATLGFVGRNERINWLLLVTGVFFVFAIRPQVAAVVILSLILAHWLSLGDRWTVGKALQGVLILGVGLGGIWLSMKHIGVDGFDTEGVQAYMEDKTGSGSSGGSAIEEVGLGWRSVPIALMNILSRPFPWEARNPMMAVSSLEILLFWGILWFRRRNLVEALRRWRTDRLLRLAVPFILTYSITLGMLIANLGIIARQRVFLFPFLFLLLEAMPARAVKRAVIRRAPASSPLTKNRMVVAGAGRG